LVLSGETSKGAHVKRLCFCDEIIYHTAIL
jgi:hypothetical protein